jgi:hypothetical protein
MKKTERQIKVRKKHTRKNGGDRETNKNREICGIDQITLNNI